MELTTRYNVLETYELPNVECADGKEYTFYIDIVLDKKKSSLEALLYSESTLIKMPMFGIPMKQPNYEGMTFCEIYNDFVEMVEGNLYYIDDYFDEFMTD